MTKRSRVRAALISSLALAIVISGCTTPPPVVVSTPPPTATPIFASDEEALAAAEVAYAAYQRTSDAILADGGKKPDRLLAVASEEVYEVELAGYKEMELKDYHSVGRSTFDSVALERFDPSGAQPEVSLYLCVDVADTDVLDKNGKSIVSHDRVDRSPFEIQFERGADGLLVSGKNLWSGENFC